MKATQISFEISDTILQALNQSQDEFINQMRLFMALQLFKNHKLSFGQAAELASLSKELFLIELDNYNIDLIDYNASELEQEKSLKTLAEIKKIVQAQKPYLAEKYGVVEIGLFGSYVRGEQRPDSDIDILIELTNPPRISLLDLVGLEYYLSDLLGGIRVETAIKENLKPRLKKYILEEVTML